MYRQERYWVAPGKQIVLSKVKLQEFDLNFVKMYQYCEPGSGELKHGGLQRPIGSSPLD